MTQEARKIFYNFNFSMTGENLRMLKRHFFFIIANIISCKSDEFNSKFI